MELYSYGENMEIKEINRNIPQERENSNDRFRVKYKDKSKFDILVVNILRIKTNQTKTFRFSSKCLPDKDSIYFSTSINNDKLLINWDGLLINLESMVNKKNGLKNNMKVHNDKTIESFPPIVGEKPKILILGTMPGKDSLKYGEYYANPRNIFWEIIYTLNKTQKTNNYKLKIDFLKQNRISIWDVCRTAIRESSLDKDIQDETPNSIKDFIHSNPTIKAIGFNGQKSEKLYDKYFNRFKEIKYFTLLSTSPLNTSYSLEQKLNDWERILKP